jgi:redox-sensitive bicupin YhaK (pirin superfamily)
MQYLTAHDKDLGGGFIVRRLLPAMQRPAVGPFVFFDHFGPIEARAEDDHDVRAHPHIGLATVTYLFEGAMQHADSTGAVQRIEPGAVNWMTAGRGVVHSERTPADLRGRARRSHGLQLWAALPADDEEVAPSFSHTPANAIAQVQRPGVTVRVLVGSALGATSPVPTRSPTLYLDVTLDAGAALELPAAWARERAVYALTTGLSLATRELSPHTLAVLEPDSAVQLQAATPARAMLIGGDPLGHRYVWWNFVSSRKARIAEAAHAWATQPNPAFPRVPGESEFIALPQRRPA